MLAATTSSRRISARIPDPAMSRAGNMFISVIFAISYRRRRYRPLMAERMCDAFICRTLVSVW